MDGEYGSWLAFYMWVGMLVWITFVIVFLVFVGQDRFKSTMTVVSNGARTEQDPEE